MPRNTLLLFLLISLPVLLPGCQPSPSSVAYHPPQTSSTPEPTSKPYEIQGKTYYPKYQSRGDWQVGTASWYGKDFHGKPTANGEKYNMYARTAAHKTLPMNTMVVVKNLENNKQTTVRINDRGPFAKKRIIDLSYTAAKDLDLIRQGTAKVQIVVLEEATRIATLRSSDTQRQGEQGAYYVQVGAFSSSANAKKLARNLMASGRRVFIREGTTRGREIYRVLVLAGMTLEEARRLESGLSRSGFPDSFIVMR